MKSKNVKTTYYAQVVLLTEKSVSDFSVNDLKVNITE